MNDQAIDEDPEDGKQSKDPIDPSSGRQSPANRDAGQSLPASREPHNNPEILRAERDILLRDARLLEAQLKGANDQLLAYERSFAGRLTNNFWRFFHWFFPIGSRRFGFARRTWRSYRTIRVKAASLFSPLRRVLWRNGFVDVEGLRLDEAAYRDFLHSFLPRSLEYRRFVERSEPTPGELLQQIRSVESWPDIPKITLVTSLERGILQDFLVSLKSVRQQTYFCWQWIVVYTPGLSFEFVDALKNCSKDDRRLIVRRGRSSSRAAINLNQAMDLAEGEFVVILGENDVLAPHALFRLAEEMEQKPAVDSIYSDYDFLDSQSARTQPLFKPDWSPDLMLSISLMEPMLAVRRSLLHDLGCFDESLDDVQAWNLSLKVAERTDAIRHIPEILVHVKSGPGSETSRAAQWMRRRDSERAVVLAHLRRLGLQRPSVEITPVWRLKATWSMREKPMISVIIPSRDQAEYLDDCLDSIFGISTYQNLEVLVVDTGSQERATQAVYQKYGKGDRFSVIEYSGLFNFGKACNLGASKAAGTFLLFLNNDTEVLDPSWIESMLQWFELPEVGVVGPKLIFPDGRIQHGGVIVGMGGIASHLFLEGEENAPSIFGSDNWYRNLSAVTGACMLIPGSVFAEVGAFDEGFQVNYSDVDLCLKVLQTGRRIVYTPDATLIHHEGVSHGKRIPRNDFERAVERWQAWGLLEGDPYFNPNLSYMSSTPVFRLSAQDTPEFLCKDLMRRLPKKEILDLPDDLQ